jgi:hypothetical protein
MMGSMTDRIVSFDIPEEFAADVGAHVAKFGLSPSELAREAFIAYIEGSRASRVGDADEHAGVTHLDSHESGTAIEGDEDWLNTPGSPIAGAETLDGTRLSAWISMNTVRGQNPSPGAASIYIDDQMMGVRHAFIGRE